jgi:hypothetical protein
MTVVWEGVHLLSHLRELRFKSSEISPELGEPEERERKHI